MKKKTNNWFIWGPSSIFTFIFSDRRTLKFIKMKCNPTNKKVWPYLELQRAQWRMQVH